MTESYSSSSFYVIVEPSIIHDCQLLMPDTFVQEHGDELLDTVNLIVPTDEFWCVGAKKAGTMIWLHDGWQEFMEHHSVCCWYFLLFKYGQNSSATEIDYQLRSRGNARSRGVAQDLSHGLDKILGDKGSTEIVDPLETEQGLEKPKDDKIAPGRIKLLRCYETRSRTNKLHNTGRLLNPKNLNKSGNSSLTKPLGGKLVRQSMKTPIHSAAATGDTRISFTSQQWENSVGYERFDRHKRGRPRASETSTANIPADFVRKYVTKTSKLIELQDSDGNKWNARCIRKKLRMLLSRGWLEFVRDNNLVVGDACVFELIKDLQADELMLKVHIFRSRVEENLTNLHTGCESEPILSTDKNCILQFDENKHTESSDAFGPASSDRTNHKTHTNDSFTGEQCEKSVAAAEANRATNAAKMFTPENPYFMMTNILPEFVGDYMPKTSEPIKLQDSVGTKWDAHCIRRRKSMFLSKGWVNFVRDKSLVVGDACVFELMKDIQADELTLKTHIFRNKSEKNNNLTQF
ncbi:unnamed protein product [Withania somnifera]